MVGRRHNLLAAVTLFTASLSAPVLAQTTASRSAPLDPSAFIKKWDRSGKGMLDSKAIANAAIVKFEMLDTAHKGRLTQQQLSNVLTPSEFAEANPDGDTTIGAVEWFDLVQHYFQAANPDNDGSLTLDELKTPKGEALLKLVQ